VTTATVNGERRSLAAGTTLEAVVRTMSDRPSGIAAAVNGAVVPRSAWVTTPIDDGDDVEVLTAVQGG
jgi:sulfur carrier protein